MGVSLFFLADFKILFKLCHFYYVLVWICMGWSYLGPSVLSLCGYLYPSFVLRNIAIISLNTFPILLLSLFSFWNSYNANMDTPLFQRAHRLLAFCNSFCYSDWWFPLFYLPGHFQISSVFISLLVIPSRGLFVCLFVSLQILSYLVFDWVFFIVCSPLLKCPVFRSFPP